MEMLLFLTLGGTEWLVIFFAIILLFGGRKIPELMRGLGKGIREFNNAKTAVKSELTEGIQSETNKKPVDTFIERDSN